MINAETAFEIYKIYNLILIIIIYIINDLYSIKASYEAEKKKCFEKNEPRKKILHCVL